jgi:SAM-dependent methyltransferase
VRGPEGSVKARLLDLIACPVCSGDFELREAVQADADGEIANGTLECRSCGSTFPIRDGVPRLLPPHLSATQEKTATAFGWQWQQFTELYDQYEAQFLDWIEPIQPEFFRDKIVLDAGCGNGRHAYYAARYGAREIVAMDLSAAVETAHANLGKLPNAHVIQGDIYNPPFKRSGATGPFDFIYSIGVLHHLPDPEAGFKSLVRFLKPGGAIFAWVYGKENNGVVHGFINPLRKTVTSRMPPSLLPAVAWPMTLVFHGAVKGVYRPLRRTPVFKVLPLNEYLYSLSTFNFRRNYNIVYDHLVAPVAFYLRREEFEDWFRRTELTDVTISWRNRNSWRGFGRSSGGDGGGGQREAEESPELKA